MTDGEVAQVRRIRGEISAECGHDIHKLASYCRQVEQELWESGEFRFYESPAKPNAPRSPHPTVTNVASV